MISPPFSPIQNVFDAYRITSAHRRDVAVRQSLSSAGSQVEEWLSSHEQMVPNSPMLTDLKARLDHPESPLNRATSIWMRILPCCHMPLNRSDNEGIERQILSGNMLVLNRLVNGQTGQIFNYIDLIKAHLEMKTLMPEDLLPIVARAAGKLLWNRGRYGGAILDEERRPSLFRLFSREINVIISPGNLAKAIPNIQVLLLQDEASSDPYLHDEQTMFSLVLKILEKDIRASVGLLQEMPLTRCASLLVEANEEGIWPLHSAEGLHSLLPLMLEKLSTDDIVMLLMEENEQRRTPAEYIDGRRLLSLSTSHYFRLVSILLREEFASTLPRIECDLPSSVSEYLDILRHRQAAKAIDDIPEIEDIRLQEVYAGIACYIEYHKVPIEDLRRKFISDELTILAYYLRYLDLCGFSDRPLARVLLNNALNLNVLYINDGSVLDGVEELPLCQKLVCRNSNNIQSLPKLPQCKWIDCCGCLNLGRLPKLDECVEFYGSNCPSLKLPKFLPKCRHLDIRGTLLANLPKVALGGMVYCSGDQPGEEAMQHTWLTVPVEGLSLEPVSWLQELGDYLLQGLPFPNIRYSADGVLSEGFDLGGLRIDFASRLCEKLFMAKGREAIDPAAFLVSDDGYPHAVEGDPSQELYYRSLGSFLAACYPTRSVFKSGSLFNEGVYRCMLAGGNPGSDEWLVASFLELKGVSENVKKVVCSKSDEIPQLSANDQIVLENLSDLDECNSNHWQVRNNRDVLRGSILTQARSDARLKAIGWMAHELKRRLGDRVWGRLKPEKLMDRVEGMIAPEAVKEKIKWEFRGSRGDPRFHKTQNFLLNWIDSNPSKDRLELFVQAVTGAKRLGSRQFNVNIYPRGKQHLPQTSTCDRVIFLSADYENQEAFNAKLECLLTEGMAGSGFSRS